MNDDALIRALAKAAADEKAKEPADPRWSMLTEGALDDGELAELERQARENPDDERVLEALRPLPASSKARLVDVICSMTAPHEALTPVGDIPEPAAIRGQVIPLRPRASRRGWWAAGGILAAAALAAVVLWPRDAPLPGQPGLPEYSLAMTGGTQNVRSGSATSPDVRPRLAAGARFQLVARPATPTTADIEAAVFARCSGTWDRIFAEVEVSPEGAVRARGEAAALPAPCRPDAELALVVAARGGMPDAAELAATVPAAAHVGGGAAWRVTLQSVVVEPAGP